MPTEPRGVLWDMDGTLLDSAEYHWLTWQEALGREGYEVTRDAFAATFGRRNDSVLRHFLGEDVAAEVIARISAVKEERFRELVRTGGIEPLPGVRRWLARLHADGWRQAIASSAPRDNVTAILDALGIAPFFAAIAADDDVVRGKPDPQVFLAAAAKLDVPPARCVVVEDALAGVEGGRRAGMRTIGVGPNYAKLPADLAVHSLEELSDDAFDRLSGDMVKGSVGAT
jgi:beta-phosphoglucomutase